MTLWELMVEVTLAEIRVSGYCCAQADCDEVATAIVHWPSGDTRCCPRHVTGWARIAEAMAVNLHSTALPVKRFEPAPDDSSIRFGLLEIR